MSEASDQVVLIVEDDDLARMVASDMFMDAGYRALEAENADEALRILETNTDVKLLFTDVSMPGTLSGTDLARHVTERWPGIGIIMASGRPQPDNLPMGIRFHAKPYEREAVLSHAREMSAPPACACP
jgi:CheY-like chemotaxis protein